MKKLQIIVFLLINIFNSVDAAHIVGGEINYTYKGNNVYHIKLKLYRDCYALNAATFDTILRLGIFNNNTLYAPDSIKFPGSSKVNDPLLAPCIVAPGNVCVEVAIYEKDIVLPPKVGGYDIVYQRCCRNSTIVNLLDANNTGATYITHINTNNNLFNNSAYFNSLPPIFLCINTPLNYDHSATDPDGDSLVYSFCDPYDGASKAAPAPKVPSNPPYSAVVWGNNYYTNYQLAANPKLTIDSKTGKMTGTPSELGQFVIGVKVTEYRNGVAISETRRDFQFNVLFCNNAVASIPEQKTFCNGLTYNFSNNSANSTNYFWDFGDLTTVADTSTIKSPSYTYQKPGKYKVMLVAYTLTGNCFDTIFTDISIAPPLLPTFNLPPTQCLDGNTFAFTINGKVDSTANYNWNFGAFATPQQSSSKNPKNIHFNVDTLHKIEIIISQFGCADTIKSTLTLNPKPIAKIGDANRYCVGNKIDFKNESKHANFYHWDFGDLLTNTDTSSVFEPSYTYPDTGIVMVKLIATNNFGCKDTAHIPFWVYPLFTPTIYPFNDSSFVNQCIDSNRFNFYATGIFSSAAIFNWSFGSKANVISSSNKNALNVTFNSAGVFPVTVTAQENGCIKSFTDTVRVYNRPKIDFSFTDNKCLPANIQFINQSFAETPINYLWNFGDSTISINKNPTHLYKDTGTYKISLQIVTKTGCKDSLMLESPKSLIFKLPPISKFSLDSDSVSILEPIITITDSSKQSKNHQFYISDGTSYSEKFLSKTFKDTGSFKIIQISYNEDGCTDTSYRDVYVRTVVKVAVPDAFTPNDDLLNDIFLPKMLGILTIDLQIFNRWGTEIFRSLDKTIGWDGKFKNSPSPTGVYNYILQYEDVTHKGGYKTGKVVLIR